MSGHLHSFGIENFRVFGEMTRFDFAPITFLVGPNSSGKSSLIKALLLLRESARTGTFPAALDFSTKYHNLGFFHNVLSRNSSNQIITIEFPIVVKYISKELLMRIEYEGSGENGIIKSFTILCDENIIFEVKYFKKDNKDQCGIRVDLHFFVDHLVREKIPGGTISIFDLFDSNQKRKPKSSQLDDIPSPKRTLNYQSVFEVFESYRGSIDGFPPNPIPEQFFDEQYLFEFNDKDHLDANAVIMDVFKKGFAFSADFGIEDYKLKRNNVWHARSWTEDEEFFNEQLVQRGLNHVEFAGLTEFGEFIMEAIVKKGVVASINRQAKNLKNVHALAAHRALNERLLSNSSSDSDLNGLILTFNSFSFPNEEEIDLFIQDGLQLFGVGSNIKVERIQGVMSQVYIQLSESGDKILLADLGFGVTQLLPMILKVAIVAGDSYDFGYYVPSLIVFEEPESNLHPNFQSKLADLLIMAGERFNIQFIIETHSEYLIRKMQYHIAKARIKPSDANIYYFHHPNVRPESEEPVRRINFEEDGRLSAEFGSGFLDEADNIAMDLFDLKRQSKN